MSNADAARTMVINSQDLHDAAHAYVDAEANAEPSPDIRAARDAFLVAVCNRPLIVASIMTLLTEES